MLQQQHQPRLPLPSLAPINGNRRIAIDSPGILRSQAAPSNPQQGEDSDHSV